MKQSDDLFDLIKSLKKTEKRYFKIYATRHSEQSNSAKLFSAIEKMTEYEEESLYRIFKGEKFLDQLAVAKNYLSKIILESMTLYHAADSVQSEITHLLQQVEFLLNRGLNEQASKKLTKAENLSIKFENLQKILECCTWRRTLQTKSNYKDLTLLLEREELTLKKLQNIFEYRKISAKVFGILRQVGRNPTAEQWQLINSTLEHPLLTEAKNAICFESTGHFLNIHAAVSFLKNDKNAIYYFTKTHVEWLEAHPFQIQIHPKSYLDSIHNYLHSCFDTRKFEEMENGLQKLKSIEIDTAYLEEPTFITIHSLELLLRITSGECTKGLESIPLIEEGLEKFPSLSPTEKAILFERVIRILIATGNPSIALKWVNTLINDSIIRSIRPDILTTIKLLNIIVHFDLGNADFAQHLIKIEGKHFLKENIPFIEYLLLTGIASLPVVHKKTVIPESFFKDLLGACEYHFTKHPEELESQVYFLSWIESKVLSKPMEILIHTHFAEIYLHQSPPKF
ncbi:MAG: hypothetical protein IPM69_05835 [Ignavibacteria bacterium]|nr:hypothetical protein [Ignavibacteria bacterium]